MSGRLPIGSRRFARGVAEVDASKRDECGNRGNISAHRGIRAFVWPRLNRAGSTCPDSRTGAPPAAEAERQLRGLRIRQAKRSLTARFSFLRRRNGKPYRLPVIFRYRSAGVML